MIDGYMEAGIGFLFNNQLIQCNVKIIVFVTLALVLSLPMPMSTDSTQGREYSYELILKAAQQSITDASTVQEPPPSQLKQQPPDAHATTEPTIHGKTSPDNGGSSSSNDPVSSLGQFKAAVLDIYGQSVPKAFAALSKGTGVIQKKAWKKAVKRLLPALLPDEAKRLRKQLHQLGVAEASSFTVFLTGGGGNEGTAVALPASSSPLAVLPAEVQTVCCSIRI